MTEAQLEQIERIVNEQIQADLPLTVATMTLDEALKAGALAFFGERYGEKVKVYAIGNFSKEVCGGPHVEYTSVLGRFELGKQETIGKRQAADLWIFEQSPYQISANVERKRPSNSEAIYPKIGLVTGYQ